MTKPRSRAAAKPTPAPAAAPPANTAPPATTPEPEFGFAAPEYDPAAYRWVPVRRRPRRDGWTEEKQRRFIEVLADTGLVSLAAREVGMTRMAAYRLRRAPYAEAFARAWDLARERAGALIEDIAFERAIEGTEVEIYDQQGAITGSRTVYNDRLLTFLLRNLKPERYGTAARVAELRRQMAAQGQASGHAEDDAQADTAPRLGASSPSTPTPTLDEALRAMEPQLPAPAEDMFDAEDLAEDLLTAEIADGKLPHFHAEQAPVKTPQQEREEALAAKMRRGRELVEQPLEPGTDTSVEDLEAICLYLDPSQARELPRKHRARKAG